MPASGRREYLLPKGPKLVSVSTPGDLKAGAFPKWLAGQERVLDVFVAVCVGCAYVCEGSTSVLGGYGGQSFI